MENTSKKILLVKKCLPLQAPPLVSQVAPSFRPQNRIHQSLYTNQPSIVQKLQIPTPERLSH
jgi:hypothetical protein